MEEKLNFPVELSPKVLDKAAKLDINPEEIEEKYTHGSGAGGQKINKTESTVCLKHLPSGISVKIQMHRSREANRKSAYRILIDKIEEFKLGKDSEIAKKVFKIRKQKQRRSRKAKEKILKEKHHRAEIKDRRKKIQS